MFNKFLHIFFFFLISLSCFAQSEADEILGYYMSPQENAIFKFYKSGEKYFAKPVWMKHPERLDTLNPDKNLKTRKIIGSVLVKDFVFDGKNTWSKGTVYDANSGKTYKSRITRDKDKNLLVRGFVGISVFGRTEYFVKVDFKERE